MANHFCSSRRRQVWVPAFAGTTHGAVGTEPLLLRFPLLRRLPFLRGLLRHLLAFRSRLGKADGDRLLAALDLLAGPAALQSSGLALLHRASDLGRCFL